MSTCNPIIFLMVLLLLLFQINLIAPPVYVVTTTTLERELGVETLKKAIAAIEESINASKGQFSVKMEVRIHS